MSLLPEPLYLNEVVLYQVNKYSGNLGSFHTECQLRGKSEDWNFRHGF